MKMNRKRMKLVAFACILAIVVGIMPVTEVSAGVTVHEREIKGEYSDVFGFSEGLALAYKHGKGCYINKNGALAFETEYDDDEVFGDFHEDLAFQGYVCYASGYYYTKYMYIDRHGKEVIPLQYYDAKDFSEGLACVRNVEYGYIDKTGKEVIPLQYDKADSFSEGLACVAKYVKSGYLSDIRYGFIDQTGKEVIPFQYNYAKSFREGLAPARTNLKWGYIDKIGKEVIPFQYDEAEGFSEGLARVEKDSMYGYIDKDGQEVIPCQYDDAGFFSEGLAYVKKYGKWGYIDKTGKEVVPCQYDDAGDFSEGLACVKKDHKYGYIDKTGKEVTPCQYDSASKFSGGLATAEKNGKWYILSLQKSPVKSSFKAPTVKLSTVNVTQTKLTWNKVSQAKGYTIYRADSQNGTYKKLADVSSSRTSYIDTTCISGRTYYYKVAVYNASGTRKTSSIRSKKVPVVHTDYSVTAPSISSVEKSGKNIVLRWEEITKGNGYVIYRSADNRNFVVYRVIKGLGTTQLTDKNVTSGRNYYYRIAAYNNKVTTQSPVSSTYVIKTSKLKGESFRTTLISVTKKADTEGTVTLKWKKLSNASGYIIYRKEGNGKYKALFTINNPSKESIDDVKLTAGQTYTYYIKPFKLVDSNGVKIKYLGSASNKKSITE